MRLAFSAMSPTGRQMGLQQRGRQCLATPIRFRVPSGTVRMLALPQKKQPERTIDIFCSKCRQKLYKYRKGGKGALVKCWVERIADNYTTEPCVCPNCQSVFAKEGMVRGRPAYKIIRDRVFSR